MIMTRKELFDLIWTRTVKGVAEEYGLNYPLLLRAIKASGIPKPSRQEIRFIQRGESGLHAIHRPDLPGNPDEVLKLSESREPRPSPEPEVLPKPARTRTIPVKKKKPADPGFAESEEALPVEAPKLIDYERHPRWTSLYFLKSSERRKVIRETEDIRIRPEEPIHPQLLKYQKEISAWQSQVEILGDENFAAAVLERPAFMERVSLDCSERVLAILDSLYWSIERLGGTVQEDGCVLIHDQTIKLRFTESRARLPIAPSVHEDVLEGTQTKYVMQYSGKLTLSIGYLYSIRDRKNSPIEDRLGDVLELLFLAAFQLSQNGAGSDRKEELDSFNRELERTESLVQQARDYEDAERIRTLIKAVQKKLATGELEYQECWPAWAAWASEKSEWLDPTVAHRDSILGRRYDPILKPQSEHSGKG